MTYDAKSIRILREDEIKRFDWHWAEELAHEHILPLDWVKRGFEASRRLGIEPDFFVNKYILKQDLPKNDEFEQVFIEVLKEDRKKSQNTL
ncbi:hypothetical protein CBG25_09480 [Arsenophonus sp. ENCA]|uniref:hypothetical protein n=1 Tax=Arsenophonus sp. ENCA TaxID=1987579 RepID=UPI000BCB42E4|nr:hypothetical protein [Arsenophonus sp. ENCA]PAV02680.1 hypothetical protein CBG25_09480 [Arsenophonus sp. ENCA]